MVSPGWSFVVPRSCCFPQKQRKNLLSLKEQHKGQAKICYLFAVSGLQSSQPSESCAVQVRTPWVLVLKELPLHVSVNIFAFSVFFLPPYQSHFKYGHLGCSYSDGVSCQGGENGTFLVGRVGQICPATGQDGFRYRHPGCSYSGGVTGQGGENGAFLVGGSGGSGKFALQQDKTGLGTGTRGARTHAVSAVKGVKMGHSYSN